MCEQMCDMCEQLCDMYDTFDIGCNMCEQTRDCAFVRQPHDTCASNPMTVPLSGNPMTHVPLSGNPMTHVNAN